jgi:hypothetical protein
MILASKDRYIKNCEAELEEARAQKAELEEKKNALTKFLLEGLKEDKLNEV